MNNEIIYFEVRHNNGTIGKDGKYSFKTHKEALKMILEFKENPLTHNNNMSQDSVNYWKKETYVIAQVTVKTTLLTHI